MNIMGKYWIKTFGFLPIIEYWIENQVARFYKLLGWRWGDFVSFFCTVPEQPNACDCALHVAARLCHLLFGIEYSVATVQKMRQKSPHFFVQYCCNRGMGVDCCCMNTPIANEQEWFEKDSDARALEPCWRHRPLSPVEGIAWIVACGSLLDCWTQAVGLLDWSGLLCGVVWYGMDGCLLKWFQGSLTRQTGWTPAILDWAADWEKNIWIEKMNLLESWSAWKSKLVAEWVSSIESSPFRK